MGYRLAWVAVLVMFSNTVTAETHPWTGTVESLNRREVRDLHNTNPDSSQPRSLAFVFDISRSMTDDLAGAVGGAKKILSGFLSFKTRPVKNFILVPYDDPTVYPLQETEDSDKFLRNLNTLKIRGENNPDCPELALSGLIKALEAAHPYSYVYLFTDASAKDYRRVDEVLKLIERKHSQVIFFITGNPCYGAHSEDFLVYEKIAGASYGQMYYLLKENVNDVLRSVLITTQPNKSNLLVVSNPKLDSRNSVKYDLSVEKNLKQLIVEVAGDSPDVDIRNPSGNKPAKIDIPFDLPNNKFMVIDHPEPAGTWVLKVTFHPEKTQRYKVDKPLITVKGVGSSYEIKQGFSVRPVDTLSSTAYRPLEKRGNYIYMEVHPTEDTKENKEKIAKFSWKTVDILKSDGKPLLSLPLNIIKPSKGDMVFPLRYLAGPFTPPDYLFSLSFHGLDENRIPITRLSSNYISAEESSAPYVKMTSSDEFVIGKELKVTCEVESLIPFSLQWYKDGNLLGTKKDFLQSSGDSFIKADAKKEDKGQYTCEAINTKGSDRKNILITGIALPEIKGMDEKRNVVSEGGSITLKCAVVSDLPYDVKWLYKKSGAKEGIILSSSGAVRIVSDSLSIPSLKPSEVGKYSCRASNKAGITEKEVEIVMISPPIVKISMNDTFMFTKGENILIDCNVATVANTTVHMEFNGNEVGMRKEIYADDTISFSVPAADKAWEGNYSCIAENEAGNAQKQVEGVYVELPSVKAISPYVAVKLNADAVLQCTVSGIPKPVVSWVFGHKLLADGPKYKISSDGSSLKILKSNLDDEGTYKCVARGPRNSESTSEVNFRIGTPPVAKYLLLNDSIELEQDGTFPCESESNPKDALYPGMKTKISWNLGNSSLDFSRHKVLKSGALKIKAANVADNGLFICTLQNDFGKAYTKLNLEVRGIVPPTMYEDKPQHRHFKQGDTIDLWCNVTGRPEPKITWYYRRYNNSDREELEDGYEEPDAIVVKGKRLTLYNAIAAYEGIFSCVGDNGAGISPPKDYSLRILGGPPVITDNGKPKSIEVTAGDDYTFDCGTRSSEAVSYKWLKNEKYAIKESISGYFTFNKDHSSLTLHSKEFHSGNYTCIATNGFGSAMKTFSISVRKSTNNTI